jgi:hypothetical protein
LVITPDAGVPRAGVIKVLLVKVSVPSKVARIPATGSVTVPDPAAAFALKVVLAPLQTGFAAKVGAAVGIALTATCTDDVEEQPSADPVNV